MTLKLHPPQKLVDRCIVNVRQMMLKFGVSLSLWLYKLWIESIKAEHRDWIPDRFTKSSFLYDIESRLQTERILDLFTI